MSMELKGVNPNLAKYYKILSDEIPDFLYEYVNTAEMQKQAGISTTCGTIYSKMFDYKFFYSSLEHSIAVALIVWNFTKDKKQTISALFHDIATPVFKHTIDFMNGDYEKQESTEELTTKIISESKEIMSLLYRDGIEVREVDNYHLYPIADNDSPKLAADRLEYTLSNGLGATSKLWNLEEVKEIYQNIEVQKNEEKIEELGFKNQEIAEKFVQGMSILSSCYITNEVKFSMQFLADIIKKMSELNLIKVEDLYKLSEKEVIEKIEHCNYNGIAECFKLWENANKIEESDNEVQDKYTVSVNAKIRYIIPLVNVDNKYIRIDKVSEKAKEDIEKAISFKTKRYAYLNFNF